MSPKPKVTEEIKELILLDYNAGMRMDRIAEKYKEYGSPSTIGRAVRAVASPRTNSGPKKGVCQECGDERYRRDLCRKHYRELVAREKGLCNQDRCEEFKVAKGLCNKHYKRMSDGREMEKTTAVWTNNYGYICEYLPNNIQANTDGRVLKHRRVMAEHMGRRLLSKESVHHINGDKTDNRLENLELWVTMQPAGQRPEDLVAYAEEILRLYKNSEN